MEQQWIVTAVGSFATKAAALRVSQQMARRNWETSVAELTGGDARLAIEDGAADDPVDGEQDDRLTALLDASMISPSVMRRITGLLEDGVTVDPALRRRLLAAIAEPLAQRRASRAMVRRLGERPSPEAVTVDIPGALADLLYSNGLLSGPSARAFKAAPVIGWGAKGAYSVRLTASLDVHDDLADIAQWALAEAGDQATVAVRRAYSKYRNRIGQAHDAARREGRMP